MLQNSEVEQNARHDSWHGQIQGIMRHVVRDRYCETFFACNAASIL